MLRHAIGVPKRINSTLSGADLKEKRYYAFNSQNVFAFLTDDMVVADLTEAYRVMKPGGLLNVSFFHPKHVFSNDPAWKDKTQFRSKDDVEELVRRAGFTQISTDDTPDVTVAPTVSATGVVWHQVHVEAIKPITEEAPGTPTGRRIELAL